VATIITKNGSGSAIPVSLTQGELAINVDSGTLYYGSGSANAVRTITASLALSASYVTGSIFNSTNPVLSASYALTASFALNGGGGGGTPGGANTTIQFNDGGTFSGSGNFTFNKSTNAVSLTGSLINNGLTYPLADNGEFSFIQSDGNGNLSLQYVNTMYETIHNSEATTIVKSTPLYVSGSTGANSNVYRADAGNPTKMPVVYIAADNIAPGDTGRGIVLGLITGVNTTGYPGGTEIYIAVGGGWTSTRPTGSAIVQVLGIVTKEGMGGQGVVLNPGPANLPNLPSGSVWVGNSGSVPVAIPTASLNVASASYALTASFALNGGGGGASFSTDIGTGADTTINVTHGLGTRDVHVTVYSASGDYATVICDVQRSSSLNDIKLIFANPPATNEYRVVVSK
jgi:hypothetical protein